MELIEYWKIIRKRILLVLLIPIVAAIVSGIYSYKLINPTYLGTATLLFNVDNTANLPDATTVEGIIDSEIFDAAVLKAHPKLGISPTEMGDIVSVSMDGELLDISAVALNQQMAAEIANDVARTFVKQAHSLVGMPSTTLVNQANGDPQTPPIGPHKKRNIGMALGFGLLIGIGLAFVLEYLDMRIRSEADMVKYLQIPILGSIQDYRSQTKRKDAKTVI